MECATRGSGGQLLDAATDPQTLMNDSVHLKLIRDSVDILAPIPFAPTCRPKCLLNLM